MKQQFEVGDKAIWKGGKATYSNMCFPKGTEMKYLRISTIPEIPYVFEFPDGDELAVSLDQIEPTTPTTIVTVHGNPDWKPEKGELEYKLLKDLPGLKAGYLMSLGDVYFTAINPAKYPDFFAPVYKEAKPIEFVKYLNALGEIRPAIGNHIPSKTKRISLISKSYAQMGGAKLDLMIATWPTDTDVLILGHFNSGTI